MKCDLCKENTHCLYLTKEHQKLCGDCSDKVQEKTKTRKDADR